MESKNVTPANAFLSSGPAEFDAPAFENLARLTAMKKRPDGSYHLAHWLRGPILYKLVRENKPRFILEIGTGRGYGCLSMAKAIFDERIDTKIFSIDSIPSHQKQDWIMDGGSGPEEGARSIDEVWAKHISPDLRNSVRLINGSSRQILKKWDSLGLPKVDFCFIDAGHSYTDVKQDFYLCSAILNPGSCVVFDDYTDRQDFGVKKFVEDDLQAGNHISIIDMETDNHTKHGEISRHKIAVLDPKFVTADRLARWQHDLKDWRADWLNAKRWIKPRAKKLIPQLLR